MTKKYKIRQDGKDGADAADKEYRRQEKEAAAAQKDYEDRYNAGTTTICYGGGKWSPRTCHTYKTSTNKKK